MSESYSRRFDPGMNYPSGSSYYPPKIYHTGTVIQSSHWIEQTTPVENVIIKIPELVICAYCHNKYNVRQLLELKIYNCSGCGHVLSY